MPRGPTTKCVCVCVCVCQVQAGGAAAARSRDAAVCECSRLVAWLAQFVTAHRLITSIDRQLRLPHTTSSAGDQRPAADGAGGCDDGDDGDGDGDGRRYGRLVDELEQLDHLVASLDDQTPLERRAIALLQVCGA